MNKVNRELKKLDKDPLDFATLNVREGTNMVDATLLGPEGTPYDGGAFHLEITIPSNYPLVPPSIRFVTHIYHPLVDKDNGKFCNEAIAEQWKAVNNLTTVMNIVYDMLKNYSNCDMAVDPDIGNEVHKNPEKFIATAKEWTEKYACCFVYWNKLVICIYMFYFSQLFLCSLICYRSPPSRSPTITK